MDPLHQQEAKTNPHTLQGFETVRHTFAQLVTSQKELAVKKRRNSVSYTKEDARMLRKELHIETTPSTPLD